MRWICLFLALLLLPTKAAAQDRYASIIVDAQTLDVLHARQIDAPRFPASLTKIMTLYVTFEAMERGEIALDHDVSISAKTARTPPVKMGLKRGQSVRLDTLIQAVAVRSSNDAAMAIAEAVGGSEAAFVARMNAAAVSLGMQGTEFRNPHGLPDRDQQTTARDMAKLAHAMLTRFPQHYAYFGQTHFRGRRNTNSLLVSRSDVDGFKTGYTRASGYNLVISATRTDEAGQSRRLIAVVLGGASSGSRNTHMSDLIDRGWTVMNQTLASESRTEPLAAVPVNVIPASSTSVPTLAWALQIDGFDGPAEAAILADRLVRHAGHGQVVARPGARAGRPVHAVRVEGLDRDTARALCSDHGPILGIAPRRCLVLSVAISR